MVIAWSDEPPDPGSQDLALAIVVACLLVKVRSMVVGNFLRPLGKKVNAPGVFCSVSSCPSVYSTKASTKALACFLLFLMLLCIHASTVSSLYHIA